MKRSTRVFALPAVVLAGMLTLAACGSDTDAAGPAATPSRRTHDMSTMTSSPSAVGTPASGNHNAADSAFATEMIPHHGQAVEMADLALRSATNAEVKALASAIKQAQDPEIAQMSGWLRGWGEPVPDPAMTGMHGGGMSKNGMMGEKDMSHLRQASGAEFDRTWLQMMVDHHTGAVAMAQAELRKGVNADAKTLAQAIITGQSNEIGTMNRLLPAIAQ